MVRGFYKKQVYFLLKQILVSEVLSHVIYTAENV